MKPEVIPERRQSDKRLKRIEIQNYVLYGVILVLFVIIVANIGERQDKTDKTARVAATVAMDLNDAICTWKEDLQSNVDASEKFLHDNPHGFLGVPAATIQEGIRNRKRTIRSFKKVTCKEQK